MGKLLITHLKLLKAEWFHSREVDELGKLTLLSYKEPAINILEDEIG